MYARQIEEIINGTKTLTQRLFLPVHTFDYLEDGSGNVKRLIKGGKVTYEVGKDYAVSPERGKFAAYVYWGVKGIDNAVLARPIYRLPQTRQEALTLQQGGFKQLRIRVTEISLGLLQDMTDQDVKDEGVRSRSAYIALWDSIYEPGAWDANPAVARIRFERVITLADGSIEPPMPEAVLPNMEGRPEKQERRIR